MEEARISSILPAYTRCRGAACAAPWCRHSMTAHRGAWQVFRLGSPAPAFPFPVAHYGARLRTLRRRVRSRFARDSLFKPFRVAPPVRLPLSEGTLGAARGPVNAAGQIHLTPAFKASYLPGLSVKTSLLCAGCVIWRFLLLMYLSTFRAKSAIFLAGTQKSYFLGFSRHQPSAYASLRRSKGGFASFLFCPRSIGE